MRPSWALGAAARSGNSGAVSGAAWLGDRETRPANLRCLPPGNRAAGPRCQPGPPPRALDLRWTSGVTWSPRPRLRGLRGCLVSALGSHVCLPAALRRDCGNGHGGGGWGQVALLPCWASSVPPLDARSSGREAWPPPCLRAQEHVAQGTHSAGADSRLPSAGRGSHRREGLSLRRNVQGRRGGLSCRTEHGPQTAGAPSARE